MELLKKVIAIAGLPGSGKTYYAVKLASEHNCLLIDDPTAWEIVKKILTDYAGDIAIICDPYFCYESGRERAEKKLNEIGYSVEWIFFENDPYQCEINSMVRIGKPVSNGIKLFSHFYKIPPGAKVIPVWNPNNKIIHT